MERISDLDNPEHHASRKKNLKKSVTYTIAGCCADLLRNIRASIFISFH